MRLVIDGRRLTAERTGVGRYLEGLLAEWAVTGMPLPDFRIVLHDPAGLRRVPEPLRSGTRVAGARWPGLVWEQAVLRRSLRAGDLLFAPTNLVPPGWAGPTAVVLFDALQEVEPDGFPWHVRAWFGWRYRLAARRAARVLVPSRASARDIQECYSVERDRIGVVYPGIGPEFRPRPSDDPTVQAARRALGLGRHPLFLFVGKQSARRHVPEVLAAFRRVASTLPDHRLVFVGPAGMDPHPHGLATVPNVVTAGFVPDEALAALMADAVALLYPSRYEGFGLPVAEALASGCPVVTLRNSALVEAGGDAPLYLAEATPDALADAMHRLASDPKLRSGRIALGLAQAAGFRRPAFAEAVKQELIDLAQRAGSLRATRGRNPGPVRAASGSPSGPSTAPDREIQRSV